MKPHSPAFTKVAVEANASPAFTEVDVQATASLAFRDSPQITFAGMLARRDARAQAYKDVFTAFPADVICGLSRNASLADAIFGLSGTVLLADANCGPLRNALPARP